MGHMVNMAQLWRGEVNAAVIVSNALANRSGNWANYAHNPEVGGSKSFPPNPPPRKAQTFLGWTLHPFIRFARRASQQSTCSLIALEDQRYRAEISLVRIW
jgi:hypothetical protein